MVFIAAQIQTSHLDSVEDTRYLDALGLKG
jgi:hypothetical protein